MQYFITVQAILQPLAPTLNQAKSLVLQEILHNGLFSVECDFVENLRKS